MNTAVIAPQSFEERMKARIKESIGDLITDEDLTKMVERSMEEVFFKPRTVPDGSYHTKQIPSFLNEIVKSLLEPQVRAATDAYIKAHHEEVGKTIKEVVAQGMGYALVSAINARFQTDLQSLQINIMNGLQR